MMKKLLVLMLVLGMASLANAALETEIISWDVVGSQLIGTGTELGDFDGYLTLAAYGNSLTTISPDPTTDGPNSDGVMAIAGNNAKVTIAMSSVWRVIAGDIAEVTQETGEWFRFNIDALTATEIYVYDANFAQLGGGTITVPEPMSMVLLGLGGLFLRRRK